MPDESTLKPDPRGRRWVAKWGDLAVGVVFVVTLTTLGARWHWLLELTVHFTLQLAIGAACAGGLLLATRHWWLASLAGLLLLVNLVRLSPFVAPTPATEARERDLRCISANLERGNDDFGRFVAFLEVERPDVVVLIEVDESWVEPLDVLRNEYPHQHWEVREDCFGITLLSRFPLVDVEVVDLTELRLPTLVARVAVDGELVTIIGSHPLPPMGALQAASRNGHLRSLAELAATRPGPAVLLGDLNITPWSPFFGDLLREGNLRDARVGHGLQPTWPSLPWPLRIPIDHALVSPGVEVLDFRAGAAIGSDHRPIIVDLALPR